MRAAAVASARAQRSLGAGRAWGATKSLRCRTVSSAPTNQSEDKNVSRPLLLFSPAAAHRQGAKTPAPTGKIQPRPTRFASPVDPQVSGAIELLDLAIAVSDPRLQNLAFQKVQQYLDVNSVSADAHPSNENTLLTHAAKKGSAEAIDFLVEKCGASLNATCDCPQHRTALHYAAMRGHAACVAKLIALGADARVEDAAGRTPIDEATEKLSQHALALKAQESARASSSTVARCVLGFVARLSSPSLTPERAREFQDALAVMRHSIQTDALVVSPTEEKASKPAIPSSRFTGLRSTTS